MPPESLDEALHRRIEAALSEAEVPHAEEMVVKVAKAIEVKEVAEPVERHSFLTLPNFGRGNASSWEGRHVVLRPGKLVSLLAESALTLGSIMVHPWLSVLAVVVVCRNFASMAREEIDRDATSVLWTIFIKGDDEMSFPKDRLLDEVNRVRAQGDDPPLSESRFSEAIVRLSRLRVVETTSGSKVRIRDYVRVDMTEA